MNETADTRLQHYRSFLALIKVVAAEISGKINPPARKFSTHNTTIGFDFVADGLEIKLTYTNHNTPYGPQKPKLYIGSGSKQRPISNLSGDNLKKHLLTAIKAARAEAQERSEEIARDKAIAVAQKRMVETLNVQLALPDYGSFKAVARPDDDCPTWNSARGSIKLSYIQAKRAGHTFDFTYNFDYNLTVEGTAIKSEIETSDFHALMRTMRALASV